jgi:hypothetical protein
MTHVRPQKIGHTITLDVDSGDTFQSVLARLQDRVHPLTHFNVRHSAHGPMLNIICYRVVSHLINCDSFTLVDNLKNVLHPSLPYLRPGVSDVENPIRHGL